MLYDNSYVYKKEVDWSLLHQGVTIPVTIQIIFHNVIKNFLPRGQYKEIFLVLEGRTNKARLVNQKFDEQKYPNRKDIMQIRYNTQSDIAERLRTIFASSYWYLLEQRHYHSGNSRIFIRLPEEQREYLAIYTTEYPDTYLLECFTQNDMKIVKKTLVQENEQEYESSINYNIIDTNATIATVGQIVKVRKLNRAIGETLKLLYNYRCQICGENISARYGVNIVETHHIDPFVESLNNNADNQIIICPNHHRIIHQAKPVFDRKRLIFAYLNGLGERIILNQHL